MNLLPCEVKKKINSEFHLVSVLVRMVCSKLCTCVFRYHLEYRDNFSFSDIFNLRLQLTLQSERNTQLSAIQITTEQHHRSSQSSPLWSSRLPSSTETKLQPNRREKKNPFHVVDYVVCHFGEESRKCKELEFFVFDCHATVGHQNHSVCRIIFNNISPLTHSFHMKSSHVVCCLFDI